MTIRCFYLDKECLNPRDLAVFAYEAKAKYDLAASQGIMLLVTCLRVEIYAESSESLRLISSEIFGPYASIARQTPQGQKRLLEIACGLKSQLVGERQILAQVEQAIAKLPDTSNISYQLKPIIASAKRLRDLHNFNATLDYNDIAFKLIDLHLLDDPSESKLCIVGAGMIGTGLLFDPVSHKYQSLCLLSRSAKQFRKLNRGRLTERMVVRNLGNTLSKELSGAACVMATTDVTEEYKCQLLELAKEAKFCVIVDFSARPILTEATFTPYITMYDNKFLALANANTLNLSEKCKQMSSAINSD